MTSIQTWTFKCDAEGCDAEVTVEADGYGEAQNKVTDKGWLSLLLEDFCPDESPKTIQEVQDD